MSRILAGMLCAVVVTAIGCGGSDGPRKYSVTGNATFDGEPIEKGYIIFQPTSPDDRPEATDIIDGKFRLTAIPGDKKVEITGTRSTMTKAGKGEEAETEENYIPDKYNKKTELTAEVTDDAKSNEFEFELKSK